MIVLTYLILVYKITLRSIFMILILYYCLKLQHVKTTVLMQKIFY